MEEIPLYWESPFLFDTETRVIEVEKNSSEWKLLLERAPFYPGGGGQPADTGTINGNRIIRISREDDRTFHILESDKEFHIGDTVRCIVNKEFRLDSMEQHSGQHMLSAALAEEGYKTVSVHLGSEYTGIEVEGSSDGIITEESVKRVLEKCDRWISENRKIISRFLSLKEIEKIELRRPVTRVTEPVRIIEIENLDMTGCGGVHLESTTSIGPILFLGSEKIRGRLRMKWLIGHRAAVQARTVLAQNQQLQKLLSSSSREIPEKVDLLLKENQQYRKKAKSSSEYIGTLLAESWLARADESPFIVESIEPPYDSRETLDAAAAKIRDSSAAGAFIMGGSSWIFYSREKDSSFFEAFLFEVLNPYKGKGGGKPPIWRGRIEGSSIEILSSAENWLKTANRPVNDEK